MAPLHVATLTVKESYLTTHYTFDSITFRGKWDYELYLSFDLYTKKHTQWFYFSVKNMRKDQTYRFTIVNLYKVSGLELNIRLGLC